MDLALAGRTFLVTGGSAGIGLGTVRRLVTEGANVAACARGEDTLRAALTEVDPSGEQTLAVPMDIAADGATDDLVAAARDRFGRIDGVVNNAGTSLRTPFDEIDQSTWDEDMGLKLFPAMRLVQAVRGEMRERGDGAVVNVLSVQGKHPPAGSMPTSVTRAAGLAMTKALSKELGPDGIRVNAVCVGIIKSAQIDRRWQAEAPELDRDTWYRQNAEKRNVPLGRGGEPDEVAAVIALLLSPTAGYTTGAAVNVDGGVSAVT